MDIVPPRVVHCMTVQAPPETEAALPEIDAGVIEDARARQRRHRNVGVSLLLAALIAGALIAGLSGGGGGGAGPDHVGRASGSGKGPAAGQAAANTSFPGAPATQRHGYGVQTGACPLAPANRYLPPHSGCVTVRRADINGDGRRDLVIVYSRLSRKRWPAFPDEPASMKHDFSAQAAFLRVVLAGGGPTLTSRITGGTRAAAIDAVAHVTSDPGDEIFLEINRISSGATGVGYGFHAGRLVPAGALLSYDGDSGVQAGFDCLAGSPPRLIQRYFTFVGPDEFTRSWRETEVVYAWHGTRLVRLSKHTEARLVRVNSSETHIGAGCLRGVS